MGNRCCSERNRDSAAENEQSSGNRAVSDAVILRERIRNGQVQVSGEDGDDTSSKSPGRLMDDYLQLLKDNQAGNLKKMREHLKNKPELFILNNLVLSIQFFEHFERDMEEIGTLKMEQESTVNAALADIRRRCHYEGALAETVGRHYRYLAKKSPLSEVVPNIRYNILHRNMEVYPKELFSTLASKEYTSVDDPIYRFCMEDAEDLPGWVMLRCVDVPTGHRHAPSDYGSSSNRVESVTYDRIDYNNDSDGYSKNYSDYGSLQSGQVADGNSTSDYGTNGIARRPPMKTPDHTSSSSSEEIDGTGGLSTAEDPQTGKELMKDLQDKIKSGGEESRLRHKTPPSKNGRRSGPDHKPPRSTASGRTSSEDDYDYTSVNDLPRLLKRPPSSSYATTSAVLRNSAFPPDCFQSVRYKHVDPVDNPLGIGAQFEWRTYFSSKAFFRYFAEAFYEWSNRIDRELSLEEASAYKSAIYCTQVKTTPNCRYRATFEFVPVIPLPSWPDVAREWETRQRQAVLDPRTNLQYRWPRTAQIETVIKQGCHLMTEGGKKGGRSSSNIKLEWQLSFGAAEEVLLSSLSRSHLQALMWTRLIFRHVLAPMGVLSLHHVETVFFWLVEKNYIDWQEAELGERIMSIYTTLHDCVMKGKLPHYFIRKRNLLQTKAPRDILKAQEKLFRLIEGFVPLTVQAAKHLQSTHSLYPMPNLTRLWEIITTPMSIEHLIDPGLRDSHRQDRNSLQSTADAGDNRKNTTNVTGNNKNKKMRKPSDEGFFERVQKQQATGDKTRDYLRKERARKEAEEREKQTASIAEDPNVEKIRPFNFTQTKMVLEFFIEHFIAMGGCSNRIGDHSTSTVLLDQAENLAKLLDEHGFRDVAETHMVTIHKLRMNCRPKPFTEPSVNIPGTPCVFLTGISPSAPVNQRISNRVSRNSSNMAPKPPVPLPQTPDERLRPEQTNGQVSRSLSSVVSHNPNGLEGPFAESPASRITASTVDKVGSVVTTRAVIESVSKSNEIEHSLSTETDRYDDRALPTRLTTIGNNAILARTVSSDIESTDF